MAARAGGGGDRPEREERDRVDAFALDVHGQPEQVEIMRVEACEHDDLEQAGRHERGPQYRDPFASVAGHGVAAVFV